MVTAGARRTHREIGGQRIIQEDQRRRMVARLVWAAAMDAPTLVAVVAEVLDLLHQSADAKARS